MAGGGEDPLRHATGAGRRSRGASYRMAGPRPRRGHHYQPAGPLADGRVSGGDLLFCRRAGAGVQRGADPDRVDVQYGDRAYDFLRVRLLPVERSEQLPRDPEAGPAKSAGLCERGIARHNGATSASFTDFPGSGCLAGRGRAAHRRRTETVQSQGSELSSWARRKTRVRRLRRAVMRPKACRLSNRLDHHGRQVRFEGVLLAASLEIESRLLLAYLFDVGALNIERVFSFVRLEFDPAVADRQHAWSRPPEMVVRNVIRGPNTGQVG